MVKMKKSQLRQIIKEEITTTLSEEYKEEIKDQINRSLEKIEDYLYYMPDQSFATVMKRWFSEYSDAADKEAMDMLRDLEKSLKRFIKILKKSMKL
jgi:predicted ATP-dependent endonuclease of OLD family